MNKTLKYALLSVGGLIALFFIALAVIALTVDPNKFKPQIVQMVQEKKQRTLAIEGDIKLKLFPKLGVDLGRTRLSEHKGSGEFAAVDSVRLYVAWLPLLKKELVVDKVTVEGARANLVRNADGTTNFDDLMSKEESAQVKFDIDGVRVSKSALSFDDRMAKRRLAISDFGLESGRIKDNTHTDIKADFRVASDNPKLATTVSLKSGLLFALEDKHYALDGMDLKVGGEAAGISHLDLGAKGDVDVKLKTQEIALKDFKLAIKGTRATDKLDLELDAPKLALTESKAEGAKIAVSARVEQPSGKLTAALTAPNLSGSGKQFQVSQLGLDLDVENAKLPKGRLSLKATGSAQVDLDKHQAGVDLHSKFDDSTIQAKLGVSQFEPLHFVFDIAIDQIDVDRYLPPKGKQAKAEPEGPIDLSGLKSLNASGSIRIGQLKLSNIKASNVRLDVKAGGGRVEINPLSANLYQGAMKGAVSATTTAAPRIAVQQNLSGISIGPLLRDLADKDLLEGRGNVLLNVTAQGQTASAMKKALNGNAAVNLQDGAIKGINIASALRTAKAKLSGGTQTQSANATEQTDFSELKASFAIHNGVAHNDDLSAKSPLLRLAGNGDIDIGAGAMDYVAKATVVGSLEGRAARK